MPRTPKGSLPTYRLHKSSGQAVVTLTDPCGCRRDRLLGTYGSPDSHAEYRRVLAEWEAACRTLPVGAAVGATDLTVAELALRAWDQFVTQHYRDADGQPTNEQNNFRQALAPLLQSHAHTLAREFGPQGLKAGVRREEAAPDRAGRRAPVRPLPRHSQRPGLPPLGWRHGLRTPRAEHSPPLARGCG